MVRPVGGLLLIRFCLFDLGLLVDVWFCYVSLVCVWGLIVCGLVMFGLVVCCYGIGLLLIDCLFGYYVCCVALCVWLEWCGLWFR